MKTVTINTYKFSELSEKAKQKAIDSFSDINVDYDWWESTYDDAENVKLKITSFDLDRRRHADGHFLESPLTTAKEIIKQHGESCTTYSTSKNFIEEVAPLQNEYDSLDEKEILTDEEEILIDELYGKIEDLEEDYRKSILEDYSIMLQNECDYLQTDAAIIETIEANDYDFTENGEQF